MDTFKNYHYQLRSLEHTSDKEIREALKRWNEHRKQSEKWQVNKK